MSNDVSLAHVNLSSATSQRQAYRPPVGIPGRKQQRWQGLVVSLLAHLLLLALIILPAFQSAFTAKHAEGAGGNGPAGGGGGGSPDAGAYQHLQFVGMPTPPAQHQPQPAPPAQKPQQPVPPPPPIPVPPQPHPVPVPPPAPPTPTTSPAITGTSSLSGAGNGGAGQGQAGAGPGSGGGMGSGEGSGRGSATGPGTGGGNAKIYPPTPTQFFLPPLPAPRELHGFRLIAWFDVDSLGRATLLRFTPSSNGDYNKRLRETLLAVKFRPAVRPDGVPVRDTVDVQYLFF